MCVFWKEREGWQGEQTVGMAQEHFTDANRTANSVIYLLDASEFRVDMVFFAGPPPERSKLQLKLPKRQRSLSWSSLLETRLASFNIQLLKLTKEPQKNQGKTKVVKDYRLGMSLESSRKCNSRVFPPNNAFYATCMTVSAQLYLDFLAESLRRTKEKLKS